MKPCHQYTAKRSLRTTPGFFFLELMAALCIAIIGTYYSTAWYRSIVDILQTTRIKRAALYAVTAYLETGNNLNADYIITEETVPCAGAVEIGGILCTVPDWFSIKKVTAYTALAKQSPPVNAVPVTVTITGVCMKSIGIYD